MPSSNDKVELNLLISLAQYLLVFHTGMYLGVGTVCNCPHPNWLLAPNKLILHFLDFIICDYCTPRTSQVRYKPKLVKYTYQLLLPPKILAAPQST